MLRIHLPSVCLAILVVLCLGGPRSAPVLAQQPTTLPNILVLEDEWGDAPPDNIEAVCRSVAGELIGYFPERKFEPIVVSRSKHSPIALFELGKGGERRVKLNVEDTQWAQFAYQFGHELGHILCNYREAKNPNLWFEESLCETATLFALRRMAHTWKERPPYSNWKSYAGSLASYADKYLSTTAQLEAADIPQWLRDNEADLRKIDRPRIRVVATHVLLPLFEQNPARWEALNGLNRFDPQTELTLPEYLADWRERLPAAHQALVDDIAKAFDLALEIDKQMPAK